MHSKLLSGAFALAAFLSSVPVFASAFVSVEKKPSDACVVAFSSDKRLAQFRATRLIANRSNESMREMTEEMAREAMQTGALLTVGSKRDPSDVHVGTVTMLDGKSFTLTMRDGNRITFPFISNIVFLNSETLSDVEARMQRLARLNGGETRDLIEKVLRAKQANKAVEIRFHFPATETESLTQIWSGQIHAIGTQEFWVDDEVGLLNFPDRVTIWIERPSTRFERRSKNGGLIARQAYEFTSQSYPIRLSGVDAIQLDQLTVLP